MLDPDSTKNDFLSKIIEIIEENLSDERFGVSELAHEVGMSRSNLLRKIKQASKLSASQFIRQVRLQRAMKVLNQTSSTVSEVAFGVGFSSTSYFIKCFREHYGYPPGEVGKKQGYEDHTYENHKPAQEHQLVAIMFTDIQGYTALMQHNEEKALVLRKRHREVFDTITTKFKGNILQYFGDGTLSTFNSAIDAVKCGIELQLAFQQKPEVPVRIGIHTGDIIFNDDGIVGDGVNVASRIESLASAGSVFISEKVYDEVKNQSGIEATPLGEYKLKNVDKPLELFAVSNPSLVVPSSSNFSSKIGNTEPKEQELSTKFNMSPIKWMVISLVVILVGYLVFTSQLFERTTPDISASDRTISKKSIAVLPFINDSNDSTNVYFINGLMESVLNNLQKIDELRVISRTSVEKYRNNPILITEIARELNVQYLVEGSGQKIGDQILLNIQLIEASSDNHLWAEQYTRKAVDIFTLQMEIAKNIATEIEVRITPEEEEMINKAPTENLVAYDYFLQGLDLMHKGNRESVEAAIPYFQNAIEQDSKFARAYSGIAISYYLLDALHDEKEYTDEINDYADKALFIDPKLAQGLIAKGLFYLDQGSEELAVSYLEKALEYNPNSALVINILADFYARIIPNTAKYLEYALKGVELDIGANDSTSTSFIYLHLSNAFVQSGFVEEAEKYINKSLDFDPNNLYSEYVKAFVLFAKNRDLEQTQDLLLKAFQKDSSRLDIMQEIGKIYYYQRDYDRAYEYYNKFNQIRKALNLNIYQSENGKIGFVLSKMGQQEEAGNYFDDYEVYAENDESIYHHLSLAMVNTWKGDEKQAIEELKLFSQEENYHFWILIFMKMDPLMDSIKERPGFKKVWKDIETKFWANHSQIKASLVKKRLL